MQLQLTLTDYRTSSKAFRMHIFLVMISKTFKTTHILTALLLHYIHVYFLQVRELLSQKLSSWHQSCSQPTKLPERALNLLRHTAPQGTGASGIAEVLRHTKLGSAQSGEQVQLLYCTLLT